jgi:hypothetical protein
VIKNLDEAEARKRWKETDKAFRQWHRHFGTPMTYRQKTEWAVARRWRQWEARRKHLENVLKAIEKS